LSRYANHRLLHSFPTRRSSDLYATLAALLGSLVSRVEDVNQMIMPMTILIVIGFIIAASGLGNPELGYLKISSYIPFFSPFVMRSEEHTSELQSRFDLVCRLLL